MDEVGIVLQGENIHRLMETPQWSSLLKVEEDMMKDVKKQMCQARPSEGMEKYALRMIELKSKHDAIMKIWSIRSLLIDAFKTKTDKGEEDGPRKTSKTR